MATIGRVAVYAVLSLIRVTPVGAQLATPEAAIRAQVQGFYRDDRDNRWPDVLDHFWVGKITARWTAPTSTHAWLAAGPLDRDSACVAGKDHVLAMSIALIDDRWARVFVTRCGGGPPDELWMLRVGEDWKSARLTPGYFTAACCRSAPPPRRGGPRGPPDPGTPGTPLRARAPPHRSTRQQSYAEGAGTARREQVPHAVPNHDGLIDRDPQPFGGREEQIGVGLCVLYLVARHDRYPGGDAEQIEVGLGALHSSTGADRPRDACLRQVGQQLACSREWTHL